MGLIEVKHVKPLFTDVSVRVYQDDILVYCNHAVQELETHQMNEGLDTEYNINLIVCKHCGAGWDKSGEQRLGSL